MKALLSSLLILAACGGGGGGGGGGNNIDAPNGGGGDAKVYMDAPANVPAMITISGTATQQSTNGGTPAQGVVVAAYKNGDTTPITMATTDAQGNFSIMVATNGQPLDGYLKATKAGNADTYLYPPAPLVADFAMASINELATGLWSGVQGLGGGTNSQGLIALEVVDTTGATVAGVAVTCTPASAGTGYTDPNGSALPKWDTANSKGTTQADGRAFLAGVTPGSVSVSATKAGATFKTHSVQAYMGALTTTIISE